MVVFLVIGGIIIVIVGVLFYLTYSRRPKFFKGELKKLEKSLFKELGNKLPEELGLLISKQLNYLKSGVRLYFQKSYSLELSDGNENPMPENIRFNRKDEFKLATISFAYNNIKYKAEFNTYSGMIWGITVRPSPKKILGNLIINFERFKLHNNPNEVIDLDIETEYYYDNEPLNSLLQELKLKYNLSRIKKPLSEKQRKFFINQSETKLPKDLLLILEQTNGFTINDIDFVGFGSWQSIPLEDDNYLILAENNCGSLTMRQSKRSTKLKFHSFEDETDIRDLGDSYLNALDIFLKIK